MAKALSQARVPVNPAPFNYAAFDELEKRDVKNRVLINKLNHAHFTEKKIKLHLRSIKDDGHYIMTGHINDQLGENRFSVIPEYALDDLGGFSLQDILIEEGRSILVAPAKAKRTKSRGLSVTVGGDGYVCGERSAGRFPSRGVYAKLRQGNLAVCGYLEDVSGGGLRIRLKSKSAASFLRWFDRDALLRAELGNADQVYFSGECRCVRVSSKEMVIAPSAELCSLYPKNEFRNTRFRLLPAPQVIFDHPLCAVQASFNIFDISPTGFSVMGRKEEAVFLAGMIIPKGRIRFYDGMEIECSFQVVYSREQDPDKVRFGFCFLDMDLQNFNRLMAVMSRAYDPNVNILGDIDMDALWNFFFESGFIYPAKYKQLSVHSARLRNIYQTLYRDGRNILASITYQNNNNIYGHISLVKAYEKVWLIHHLAAVSMYGRKTGLKVLEQIMNYMEAIFRYPSAGMDYFMFYFRPNNAFPEYFFGGANQYVNNPAATSIDTFSYLYSYSTGTKEILPEGWYLEDSSAQDLAELEKVYAARSGGLMLKAFNLQAGRSDDRAVRDEYAALGLMRKKNVYSLKRQDELKAVLIVDQSDMGVNMSELLNCIKAVVIDEKVPWKILESAIRDAGRVYRKSKVPVLIYPNDYTAKNGVEVEKDYRLLVINSEHGEQFYQGLRVIANKSK